MSRLGVLISGRGSNLRALGRAVREGRLHASIAVVVSNSASAPGLAYAEEAGFETVVIPHGRYGSRDDFDLALVGCLRDHGVRLVCLAGFMRRLGPTLCETFPQAILNIHPSLLPAFPGLHPQRQALEHGVTVTGATVHFVTPALDAGPIVLQQSVPVVAGDDERTLAERILEVEHVLYPEAVERVLHEPWRIVGRRVVWTQDPKPPAVSS